MIEKDKKVNLDIWKEHQDKEAKGLKKIYIIIFLLVVLSYILKSV
mgnify:FL=1